MVVAAIRAFAAEHATTIGTVALEALDVDNDPRTRLSRGSRHSSQTDPRTYTSRKNVSSNTHARVYSVGEMGNGIPSQEIFDYLRARVKDRKEVLEVRGRRLRKESVLFFITLILG